MKSTTFQFELRLISDNAIESLQFLRNELASLHGVNGAEVDVKGSDAVLRVHVSFVDGDAAKKIHRKLVTRLNKTAGVAVTAATSNLSEIFG